MKKLKFNNLDKDTILTPKEEKRFKDSIKEYKKGALKNIKMIESIIESEEAKKKGVKTWKLKI